MKKFLVVLLAILLVFCFSACGSDKNKDENNIFYSEDMDTNPQKGGSITIYSYVPDTLCPLLSKNNANIRMLNIVFDGLFYIDENLNASPCLASSFERLDNNKKYIVSLKENILFHDKTNFSAKDVVFSVDTIKQAPESAYYHNVSMIESVRAIDNYKIEFNLIKPMSRFENLLDFPIIKYQNSKIDKEKFVPIGTGGFAFSDKYDKDFLYLIKNDSWWGGEVYLDSVKVKLLPDKETAIYALSSGELSLCPQDENTGSNIDSERLSSYNYMTEYFNFIGFNHKNTYLSSQKIRQAISYAIDRETILKGGTIAPLEVSNTPFRKDWLYITENKPEIEKDLDKAKKLLEEEGFKILDGIYKIDNKPLEFNIIVNEESLKKEHFVNKIKDELSAFGITINIEKLPFDLYKSAINSGEYDMFVGSINLSKELDFEYMFKEGNMFFINDEPILESAKNIQLANGKEDFSKKTIDVIKKFNEKVPFVGLGFENNILIYKNNVSRNLRPASGDIYFGIEKVYIKK